MKKTLLLITTTFCFLNLINAQAGRLDSSFGKNGIVTANSEQSFKKTAIQKDGKTVMAGSYWNGNNYDFAVTRYNTNGSPDNTFSSDGTQTTDFASKNDFARSIAIQSDGKIVVAGVRSLARYNTDGSLDKTFSGDGKQTSPDSIYITSVAIQSDGKIVVAGDRNFEQDFDGEKGEDIGDPAAARYNTDGSLDKTFGVNGKQTGILYQYGVVSSLVIQNDGKIVIAGVFATDDSPYSYGYIIIARLNTDGSLDTTFGNYGQTDFNTGFYGTSCDIAKQNDDKIVIAATGKYRDRSARRTSLGRFNTDGSIDSSFKNSYYDSNYDVDNTSIALQNNGKIVVSGLRLSRFNADGSDDSTFDSNAGNKVNFAIQDIAIASNKLYAVGGGKYGTAARYLLDSSNTAPTVSITSPANNTVYPAPANITVNATAGDPDGTIKSVKFYNGTTYLKTDFTSPYSYTLSNLAAGTYSLTAKATDNNGAETVSAAVIVKVNKAPAVRITSPANNAAFTAPAKITVNALAADTDGSVYSVKFYLDSAYLKTDFTSPYSYTLSGLRAGTYTITAKATDNNGAQTISAPVTVKVVSNSIVSSRPYSETEKTALNDAFGLRLSPNPANNIININTSGLQQGKPATLSVISISGNMLKTINISKTSIQLDVSLLAGGVYTLKIVSGDKVMYKQFVKL